MRRITLWFLGTVSAVVLLFAYRTSTSGPAVASDQTNSAAAPGVVSGGSTGPTPAPVSGSGSSKGSGSGSDTVANGSVAQTRWGPVQVQVRIARGRITDVSVLQQPNGNRTDRQINADALPQLRQQVLETQSGNIDGVSGATVTSDGYRESLQAALDSAHFG